MSRKYSLVDLFAGAGGLSLGFAQTGQFKIVMAAENNEYARKTYARNHNVNELKEDVREIDYKEIHRKYGPIDVVIGGPPCQGFSNANRQRAIISMNNGLVKEFYRAIMELKPAMFVMENVSTIQSDTHRFFCTTGETEELTKLGIAPKEEDIILSKVLPIPNCTVESIEVLFAHYKNYLWTEKFFHAVDILFKRIGNKEKFMASYVKYKASLKKTIQDYTFKDTNNPVIQAYQELYRTLQVDYDNYDSASVLIFAIDTADKIQRMFRKYNELKENNIEIQSISVSNSINAKVKSYPVLDYIKAIVKSDQFPYEIQTDTLKALEFGAPQKRERFIIIGSRIGEQPTMPSGNFSLEGIHRTVKDAISDLEKIKPSQEQNLKGIELPRIDLQKGTLISELRDSDILFNHFNTVTGEIAQERFDALAEGENFHSLPDNLKSTYSNEKRTQSTIYMKLKYDKPCGTVVNVRKSMWIHPIESRALSVREAARLQTFPDSFVFIGTKDSQYQQVGNAVPPILARAIAEKVLEYLKSHDKQSTRKKILLEIKIDGSSTEKEIADHVGIQPPVVSYHMRKLQEEGKIYFIKNGKRHIWHLIEEGV